MDPTALGFPSAPVPKATAKAKAKSKAAHGAAPVTPAGSAPGTPAVPPVEEPITASKW